MRSVPRQGSRVSRRGFVLGAAFGATFAAGRRRATASPRPVLFIGDSMVGGGFGLFLERRLEDAGHAVVREGRPSTGLARPDFFDWIARARELVAEHRPFASLVMFGGNDAQGLFVGRKGAPAWIRWHEPGWTETYAERVGRLADVLLEGGARLGWIGMPPMGKGRLGPRMVRLNRIYRAEMAIRPRARFVDIWDILADRRGRYAARLPVGPGGRRVRVRAGDDVHLTVAGARYLAAEVEPLVTQVIAPGEVAAPTPSADG